MSLAQSDNPPAGDVFWEARELPVFCNVLCATRAEALAVPRGDMRLAYEPVSGLVRNVAFDPQRMDYDARYENSLHFSPRFQAYADELVERLTARHNLHNRDILEIACGQGDFLSALCRAGQNRGVGFDPAFDAADAKLADGVRVVQEYYSSRHAEVPADFICCRHALEHIPDPVGFLRELRKTVGDRRDTIVFFEVPNGLYTLRELGIWDLIYEHCTYFVPESLHWCFTQAGFEVLDLQEVFDGQFLTIEVQPAAADGAVDAPAPRTAEHVRAFAAAYREKVAAWGERIADLRAAGRKAVVWGSGSKGVTFLNVIRPEGVIDRVVDINPRKQGKFVAGTGQPIVAPATLPADPPDVVVVMNAIYLDEIRATLAGLGIAAEVIAA
ncbi:MAG TPA: class I SAM-dependent methyltransferase [Phycisphaerae bacterium]|nr:class I SAM-dependent methyltransferase [Phycisphaerae bacterium]